MVVLSSPLLLRGRDPDHGNGKLPKGSLGNFHAADAWRVWRLCNKYIASSTPSSVVLSMPNAGSKSEVVCDSCGVVFLRKNTEINRSKKLGRLQLCSRNCSGKCSHKADWGKGMEFKYYLTEAKKRTRVLLNKGRSVSLDIDAKFLKELFYAQKGLCALSGLRMIPNSRKLGTPGKSPYYASLDRIDNTKGYTKDNVQFVCLGVNYMRNTFTITQTMDFLKDLQNNG